MRRRILAALLCLSLTAGLCAPAGAAEALGGAEAEAAVPAEVEEAGSAAEESEDPEEAEETPEVPEETPEEQPAPAPIPPQEEPETVEEVGTPGKEAAAESPASPEDGEPPEVSESVEEVPPKELAAQSSSGSVAYAVEGGNIYFDPATGSITDCDDTVTRADIPSSINGVAVTSIGESAFYECRNLTSVTIPGSVNSIGAYVFSNCRGLKSITIPNSVTSIGDWAFQNCGELGSASIPNSVTRMGRGVFQYCSVLTSVTIPNLVTSIEPYMFYYCSALKSVTIPNRVTTIGENAFYGCDNLGSISIPNSVTSIGENAFTFCSALTNVIIPAHVTDMGNIAFFGCDGLKSAGPIGSGCNYQFGWTDKIPDKAFSGCSNLTSITIPDTVTRIGEYAFQDCSGLTGIAIPGSVISIGNNAFQGCNGLTSVTIPGSVTSIGDWTFYTCSGLKSVTIPSGVTSIGMYAFSGCSNLKSVTIPNSITSIKNWAFSICSALTDVYYTGDKTQWDAIEISSGNEPLISATIHYNNSGSGTSSSVYSTWANTLTLTVSENQKGPGTPKDDYRLSAGAAVTAGGHTSETPRNGTYQINNLPSLTGFSVSKDGFAPVTVRTPEQLAKNPKIYLEPLRDGYPTVTAVWLDNVDIRHFESSVDLLSTEKVTIKADVAWDSGKGEGTIKLVQGAKSVTFSGNTVTTILKDNFDVGKTIYIWAGYDDTYKTMKPLKLKAATAIPPGLDGIGFNLGNGMNFTLPDELPLLGGTKMGVGLLSNSPVPVTIEVEDGKVYAAIGYRNDGEYSKLTGWTAKSFSGTVKTLKKTFKDAGSAVDQYKKVQNVMKAFGGKVARVKGSFGVDVGFDIMGFAEGYLDESGNVQWLDSGVFVCASGSVDYSFPFWLGPVPLFFETELSAEASAQLNLLIREAAKSFTPNGVIEGSISLSGGLGIGLKKVASLSGGLEGELKDHWEIILDEEDYNRLTAKLKGYAKVSVLFFSGKKEWDLAEKTWEWPNRASLRSLEAESYAALYNEMYDPGFYTLASEEEMTDSSVFLANDAVSLFSAEGGARETPFAADVYSQAAPQLAAFSDGTLLAVWTGLDNGRATYDRPRLYYALCENGVWSAPIPVDASGSTLESAPSLTVVNDTAYLAWCRANASMGTTGDLTEAAAKLDIFAGVFDRTNKQWTVSQLTDGQTADFSPVACGGEGGAAVVWQSNSANDLFCQSGTTSISGSRYIGGTWAALPGYDDVGEISDLTAGMNGRALHIAWTRAEADGTFSVYMDGARQGSGSGTLFDNGNLYWYQDGHLYRDGQDTGAVLASDRFQIENNTLLYISGSGLYSTLMAHYYDAASGRWSDAVALTDGRQFIGSFSAASAGMTGQVLMSSTEVIKEMADIQSDSDDPYGSTNLVLLTDAAFCDLSIGKPWYAEDTYVSGSTMEFHLEVTNHGTVPTNYVVSVSGTDGAEYNTISSQRLLPGCTEEVTVAYEQGETPNSQLTFTVKTLDENDTNPTNNQTVLTLQYEDVAVENIGNGVTEDGEYLVYADVVNRGYSVQSGITVSLYQDAVSDSPLQTVTVDSLDSMSGQPVHFRVPTPTDQSCYVIAVTPSGTDMNAGTDSDFTVCTLQESTSVELISADGNQIELWLDNVPAGTLVVAAYDGSGKMDTVGMVSLAGGETEVRTAMRSAVPAGDTLAAYVLAPGTRTPLIKKVNLG